MQHITKIAIHSKNSYFYKSENRVIVLAKSACYAVNQLLIKELYHDIK